MILDERNEFADAVALSTGGTGSALVGDVIDLGGSGRDIGIGEPLHAIVTVDTTVTSTGSATVQFHLVSDAQAAIATDGSASYHFSSAAIPVASLGAGARPVAVALPSGNYERYLGVLATVGTAALGAGKVNAFLTPDLQAWKATPDAI